MQYIEIISLVEDIERVINMQADSYGLYSVDKHQYFKFIINKNFNEQTFVDHPTRFTYTGPRLNLLRKDVDKFVDYLLDHKGNLYFPAHQTGSRHGFKISFDINKLSQRYDKPINDLYIQEHSGQIKLRLPKGFVDEPVAF